MSHSHTARGVGVAFKDAAGAGSEPAAAKPGRANAGGASPRAASPAPAQPIGQDTPDCPAWFRGDCPLGKKCPHAHSAIELDYTPLEDKIKNLNGVIKAQTHNYNIQPYNSP